MFYLDFPFLFGVFLSIRSGLSLLENWTFAVGELDFHASRYADANDHSKIGLLLFGLSYMAIGLSKIRFGLFDSGV